MKILKNSLNTNGNISKKTLQETKFVIPENIVNSINKLIEKKQENKMLNRLEALKRLGKQKYKKTSNISQKEEILKQIIVNLEILFNDLDYKEVYNSSASLGKESINYKNLVSITNMVSIGLDKNVEGANCHSWIFFIYNIIKDITSNDPDIKYDFVLSNKNHGLLYISINQTLFLYHQDFSKHIFKIKEKKIESEDYRFFDNEEDFNSEKNKKNLEKNLMTYSIGKKYFKVHRKFGFILIENKTDEENFKKINIPGLKFISKKLYRFLKYVKVIGLSSKIKEISILKEKINTKKMTEDEIEMMKKFFYNINYKKLEKLLKK